MCLAGGKAGTYQTGQVPFVFNQGTRHSEWNICLPRISMRSTRKKSGTHLHGIRITSWSSSNSVRQMEQSLY
jgi:hypothetical protein